VLHTKTRLTLLLHHEEANKPTNTGGLAALALAASTVVKVGQADREPVVIPPAGDAILLFPAEHAVPISPDHAGKTLVVPDGTWRQARKMRTRIPGLEDLPCVTLPAGPPTQYRLRAERRLGGLSTLEAIARALAVLEGDERVHDALVRVQKMFTERTLWMRGAITDGELTGGVPRGARRG
jgi:DTW domain-containing protein YfiP